jgi:hypothetical protein
MVVRLAYLPWWTPYVLGGALGIEDYLSKGSCPLACGGRDPILVSLVVSGVAKGGVGGFPPLYLIPSTKLTNTSPWQAAGLQ